MSIRSELGKDVTVLILGGGRGTRLEPLTRLRAKPAVPVAGKFRLIDIPISNAINSGMLRMYVLTQYNSESLHRHIAQTFRFDAFSRGFVQILAAQQTIAGEQWFQGTADAVRQNLHIVRESRGEHILILAGDHMYRMDYRQLLREHVERSADVTISLLPCSADEIGGFGAVRVDPDGGVLEFREKPKTAAARAGMEVDPALLDREGVPRSHPYLASMGIYVFRRDTLISVLEGDATDFGGHVIPAAVADGRHVHAHFFKGYWRDIGTIRAFYDAHMDLVCSEPPFDFYDPGWPFYTHPRYLPGSRVDGCHFHRAILAEGASLDGCTVEHSIIGVRSVLSDATVRRSLIMGVDPHTPAAPDGAPPVGIGRGSVVERAIVDKNARIGRSVRILNEAGVRDADGPGWTIREGIVVIEKNAVIPDGTVI